MEKKEFKEKVFAYFIFLVIGICFSLYMYFIKLDVKEPVVEKQISNSEEVPFYGKLVKQSDEKENVTLDNWIVDIQIEKDGSLTVTETWDAKYHGITTMFRNFGGEVKEKHISNVEVYKVINNEMYPLTKAPYSFKQHQGFYHTGYTENMYEIGWGIDPNKSYDKYIIKYNIYGMTSFIKDYAEIYHKIISFNNLYTKNFSAIIAYNGTNLTNENAIFFGHGNNNLKYKYNDGKIEIKSYGPICMEDLVEYRLFLPKNLFVLNPKIDSRYTGITLGNVVKEEKEIIDKSFNILGEVYRNENKIYAYIVLIYTLCIMSIVCFLDNIIAGIIRKIRSKKIIKNHVKDFRYFNEIPKDFDLDLFMSGEIGDIVADDKDIIKSSILKLIYYGYIEIKNNINENINAIKTKNENIYIIKNLDDVNYKTMMERFSAIDKFICDIFIKIKDSNNEVSEKDFLDEFNNKINEYMIIKENETKTVKTKLIKEEYLFPSNIKEKSKYERYMFVMWLTIFVLLLCASITLKPRLEVPMDEVHKVLNIKTINEDKIFGIMSFLIFINYIINVRISRYIGKNLKTIKGIQKNKEIKALQRYFKDFSNIKDRDEKSLIIWEKLLIYATFFGLGAKVLANIKNINPELYSELNSTGGVYFLMNINNKRLNTTINNYYAEQARINGSGSSFGGSFSSGSFSGGGFGGGSGGGR